MRNILFIIFLSLGVGVKSQNIQRIHQSNGTMLQLPMSSIDSITYSTNAQSQTIMSIYQSNGSVIQVPASTIDSVTYLTINPGNLATLTTISFGYITATTAVSGGSISSDGGSPVTHRGICWSTFQNPTTANNVVASGSGTGTFTVNLSGLASNTTYYIRAYAINTKGTAYGNQLSFTTSSAVSGGTGSQFNNNLTYGTVTDIDGNVYKTILIGSQIWMAENLRVTKYRDGVGIPNITDNLQWQNNTTGAWSYYNQNAINNLTYGKLYNWHAIKNSRNICPAGWHLPKDEEWTILENTLGPNSVAGGKMKSTGTTFWASPNADALNSSGFSALPAGSRSNAGEFLNAREYGLWWSASDFTSGGWMRFAEFMSGNIYRDQFNKNYGLSVRCVFGDLATIETNSVSDITDTTAIGGGNISEDAGASIIARGIVWSTNPNPTIFLPTKTNDGTGSGSFSSVIEGLLPGTTYFVRAYATNIVGTTYGKQDTFTTTLNLTLTYGSMSDIDGNTYKTIQIGTQTWMAENLRTTKYRDSSNIPVVTDNIQWWNNYNNGNPLQQPMMCWYNNDQATYTANKFGALYNWYAINPATNGNKNVCPTGWHVPTDAEWTTLTTFLGGESVAGGKMKITGIQYWLSPNAAATNSSSWSGLPGGGRGSGGTFGSIGSVGYWWSSTEFSTSNAWYRYLGYYSGDVYRSYSPFDKAFGFSVRCVRD